MKNFCALMCIIIQNMLQYYITKITNVNPLKPKVIKFVHEKKSNVNETTIHHTIAISSNKK